jgi:hypothetical protein
MKRPNDIIFQVLRVSCLPQEFKYPPKRLGYLARHRWDTELYWLFKN